ncbi:MAG: hypothetical protein LBH13_04240 [Cellulomonadaceae bacterium]|jgi:hypothetical protein|nr:hypothetical protein [Cellulomonadaceae bacterium]
MYFTSPWPHGLAIVQPAVSGLASGAAGLCAGQTNAVHGCPAVTTASHARRCVPVPALITGYLALASLAATFPWTVELPSSQGIGAEDDEFLG